MGLDAYIYSHPRPQEEQYWRKNHYLQAWFANRWVQTIANENQTSGDFNLEQVPLTPDLVKDLISDLKANRDAFPFESFHHKEQVQELISIFTKLKTELNDDRVFYYTSWW